MKLQNNFTSVEQSMRLLEIGVPENSADCYFNRYNHRTEIIDLYDSSWAQTDKALAWCECFVPCWSVGRLIEILSISYGKPIGWIEWCKEQPPIETIFAEIEAGVCQNMLDFSKLEDKQ